MKFLILLTTLTFTQLVVAKSNLTDQMIEKAATEHQLSKSKLLTGEEIIKSYYEPLDLAHDCPPPHQPPSTSCVDAVCNKLGTYGCNEHSEIERVGRMCRGVYDGQCINNVCNKLGPYGCNELSEMEKVTSACKNTNSECINIACSYLGPYGCNEHSEIERMGNACNGLYDVSCIKSVCDRLGTYGCNEHSELERVINSCKGQ